MKIKSRLIVIPAFLIAFTTNSNAMDGDLLQQDEGEGINQQALRHHQININSQHQHDQEDRRALFIGQSFKETAANNKEKAFALAEEGWKVF